MKRRDFSVSMICMERKVRASFFCGGLIEKERKLFGPVLLEIRDVYDFYDQIRLEINIFKE